MIGKGRLLNRKPSKPKVSEMVLNCAGDCLALGDSIGEKQEYLNGTVSAWNIACLDKKDVSVQPIL